MHVGLVNLPPGQRVFGKQDAAFPMHADKNTRAVAGCERGAFVWGKVPDPPVGEKKVTPAPMATNGCPVHRMVLMCSPSWPRSGSLQLTPSSLAMRKPCRLTPTKAPFSNGMSASVSMAWVSGASV